MQPVTRHHILLLHLVHLFHLPLHPLPHLLRLRVPAQQHSLLRRLQLRHRRQSNQRQQPNQRQLPRPHQPIVQDQTWSHYCVRSLMIKDYVTRSLPKLIAVPLAAHFNATTWKRVALKSSCTGCAWISNINIIVAPRAHFDQKTIETLFWWLYL